MHHRHLPRRLTSPVLLLALLGLAPATALAAPPWSGILFFDQPAGGAKVEGVIPTSPADRAGLQAGDVVTAVNGQTIANPYAFVAISSKQSVGSTLTLAVTRAGRALTLKLTLAAAIDDLKKWKLYFTDRPAPDFTLSLVNRTGSVSLSGKRGKAVLLFFWSTDCDSCKLILRNYLPGIHKELSGRGLELLSIGLDKNVEPLRQATSAFGLPFDVAHYPRADYLRAYKNTSKPVLILVDRRGIVREYVVGSDYRQAWLRSLALKVMAR